MQGTAMENRMNGGQVHVEVFDGHRKHFDLLVTFMIIMYCRITTEKEMCLHWSI